MARLYVNNYTSTLAVALTDSATAATVTSATGLPTISGSDYYYLTLAAGGVIEVIKVTARSGTSLSTIVRAQESTTAVAWPAGSIISLRATAESFTTGTTGAASSTDNAVARFDGTTGKVVQNSVVTISDTGATAGITDLTATGVIDLGGATSFELPNSAAPTVNANGEIALDTTITDHKGLIKYYSGEEMVIPALPIANLGTTDGHVITYDAATDSFKMAAGGGGGSLNNVVEDVTPQLGGALDVNGQEIVSVTNGNIALKPDGTGAIALGGNSTQPVELRFLEDSDNGTNYVGFKAPTAITTNKVYQLPTADGTSGDALVTDGSGSLSFSTISGGSGTTTVLEFITSQTASASATLDFTSLGNYAQILFVLNDIIPATDNTRFTMRTSTNNGVSYDSGASDYYYTAPSLNTAGSTANIYAAGDTEIELCTGVGNATGESLSGEVKLYNPAGTSYAKITGQMCLINAVTDVVAYTVAASRMTGADVDAVRFLFLTGNITSGTIYAYGLRKTNSGSSGVNDGDYGDVTVASSGTTFTVDLPASATVATDDKVYIFDTSAADAKKYVTAQSVADLSLTFKTIAVSGQSDVVADSGTDTLTLVAGTNVTITTDAGTDAITINSTASGTGDVVGPASATDNAVARFDTTTGKLIQNSLLIVADTTGNISGFEQATASKNLVVGGNSTAAGYIDLLEDSDNGANKITVTAPSTIASDKIITLPDTTGTLYISSGTDVALADGGTGASLSDPNADRIMFWDDSAGAVTWLTAGSGLTITDTTITASASSGPSFRAHASGAQTFTTSTWTKVSLQTEDWDTDADFDNATNYRFTPGTAGKYLISGLVGFTSLAANATLALAIYKNGAAYCYTQAAAGAAVGNTIFAIVDTIDFNGSTDYVELYALHNNGSNRDTFGAPYPSFTGTYLRT